MGFYKNDATAANNASVNGIAIQGSSSPANIDNALREIAAQGKQFALDSGGATTVGGTADAITVTLNDSAADAYFDGMSFRFRAGSDNATTTPTLNANAIGVKTIKKASASDGAEAALAAGDIQSGGLYEVHYRSAWASAAGAWQLIDLNHFSALVDDSSPQLGGTLDTNSKQVRWSKGADVASASELAIGNDGNYFDVTGTTTITSISAKAVGTVIKLHFDGALTLTHHATDLILPGAANITTAAGDEAEFVEYASGDWRCTNYQVAATAPGGGGGGGVEVGSIVWHAANTAPSGFLECDGSAISRTTYSDLFAEISTTFGVGDGSTTFNIPDLRGEFVRGWDNSRGVDSGRSFGSTQTDELKAHTHDVAGQNITGSSPYASLASNFNSSSATTTSTGGSETRPRNLALLPCIKY